MRKRRWIRRILWAAFIIFLMMNIIACFHAYRFTHFSSDKSVKTNSESLSAAEKIKTLFFGINNPRPENKATPDTTYTTVTLQSNKKIECWLVDRAEPRGTVILFHGYGGSKGSMLQQATEFRMLGYRTMLVDFMGAGGSEGNQTTIGYKEAEQVKTAFDHVRSGDEKNIYLYGTSLGAAAILRSISHHGVQPSGVILECPFGSLYETTKARFKIMGVPSVPMAGLLVFWGGVQNGFWAFSHKPSSYAKRVACPTLLMYGEQDPKVSREETDAIYANLKGEKRLVLFPEAGHENYLNKYRKEWSLEITAFLKRPM